MNMRKKILKIGYIILVVFLLGILYIYQLHYKNLYLKSEVNYEEIATKFIYENDAAFIEDGYELKMVSKEEYDVNNLKMTFFYKLYSYPDGEEFRVDVIVNTDTGYVSLLD